jgi:hypothetical protein
MRVRIHKAGEDNAPAEVKLCRAARGIFSQQIGAAANRSYSAIANKQRSIADDPEIGKLAPAAGSGPTQSEQLGAPGNKKRL